MELISKTNTDTEHDTLHGRLGMRVRQLRIDRGWSQDYLAEQADMHPNKIGHIERAETNVSLRHVFQIAAAFEMPLSEFLTGL